MLVEMILTVMLHKPHYTTDYLSTQFDRLATCESTHDAKAVSPDGKYLGAFQFDLTTWHSLGMMGSPTDYSYEVQKEAAEDLQSKRGWSPWPVCSDQLNLGD